MNEKLYGYQKLLKEKLDVSEANVAKLAKCAELTTTSLLEATDLLKVLKGQVKSLEGQNDALKVYSKKASSSFEELVNILEELNATDLEEVNNLIAEVRDNI